MGPGLPKISSGIWMSKDANRKVDKGLEGEDMEDVVYIIRLMVKETPAKRLRYLWKLCWWQGFLKQLNIKSSNLFVGWSKTVTYMQCRNEPNVFHEIQQTFCWGNENHDWSWKEELVWADEGATHLPNGSQFEGKVFAYVDPKFDKKCIPVLLRSEDILWESWLNIQVPSLDIQPGHVWYFLRCSVFCLAWALHWGSQCES